MRKQFQVLSHVLASVDEHFNFLYEELVRFQHEVEVEPKDDLNAENLPGELARRGIGVAQREIDGLLKLLFSRGVRTVGDLDDVVTDKRVDLVMQTFRTVKGRPPRNFEFVASLAAGMGVMTDGDFVDAVKSHMEYLDAWQELQLELKRRDEDAAKESTDSS